MASRDGLRAVVSATNEIGQLKNGSRVGPAALRRAGPPENKMIEDGGPALEASLSHPTREIQQAGIARGHAKGADVKLARMLSAIGIMAALAGCRTCWIDRDDDRPMKYGSVRDCLDYGWWGECFHPHYHCGAPDGIRDHVAVKKAAIKAANRALSEQDGCATSRDFRFGFQQAYIDIANGGTGALPAIPPSRYWAAPYRTTWGHNKARDWFSGYETGASAAQCCMPADTLSVPTSVYRGCDRRLAVGLDGGSIAATPVVNANQNWSGGGAAYAPTPMIDHRYSATPFQAVPYQQAAPNSMSPSGGAMYAPPSYGPPSMIPSPAMTAPNANGVPGGGWSSGPSPALPSYSPPMYSVPNAPIPESNGGGYSIPVPGNGAVNPPINPAVIPMHGQRLAPSVTPQRGYSASNPWGHFSGTSGFGFRSEGATR